jgi:hypothetical protein
VTSEPDADFKNYFNYFTEVEEQFQRARGTGLFLMSPIDWALVEVWKDSGIPLEAALRGIEAAFEKWRKKRNRTQQVNSVAYCAQAVAQEAQQIAAGGAPASPQTGESAPPFSLDEVRSYLLKNAADLRKGGFEEMALKLDSLAADAERQYGDLEALEQTLTAFEDKLIAIERARLTEDDLIAARRDLDLQLRPYRSKMTADQLTMLEKQYLDRRLLERANLPRLSLFYLR